MSLVTIPGASKRMRKPRSLTVEEFRELLRHLEDPFHTMALSLRVLRVAHLGVPSR